MPQSSNIFRNRRESLGLTMREIAQLLDISDRTVWRWEHGISVPQLRLRPLVATVYQITPRELAAAIEAMNIRRAA